MFAKVYNLLATVTLSQAPSTFERVFALSTAPPRRLYVAWCVTIPQFGEGGLLPVGAFAGPHEVADDDGDPYQIELFSGWTTDIAEISDVLVDRFPGTTTR